LDSNLTPSPNPPGLARGVAWAIRRGTGDGGLSSLGFACRTLFISLRHGAALRRWMAVVSELASRGLVPDLPAEYLRAVRPYVHREVGVSERVVQLIDHADWVETAFTAPVLEQLNTGEPLVLADLPSPRGYVYIRLQLQRAPQHHREGDLLLTLTLLRESEVQHNARPVDAAALGFSRFRIAGMPCLVIGGVRGARDQALRVSPMEISHALNGWKPGVLMVRVAQELARHWDLHLIGLDPGSHRLQNWRHRLSRRQRSAADRISKSYGALWEHFGARKGPPGWVTIPQNSDDKLEAVDLSPEKRARQTRRADYWIRIRNLLRLQFRGILKRPYPEHGPRNAENAGPVTLVLTDEQASFDFEDTRQVIPSRSLQTGPADLV
jgi:uncharacterized protein VirK/YbjX